MTRRLVLTADDLGVHPAADREILALLAEGAISATTMIVVAPASAETARLLRATGGGVEPRLHVALTRPREPFDAGRTPAGALPWRPLGRGTGTLTDATGAFPVDPATVVAHGSAADVTAELAAQLAWMRAAGLRPTGLDSHSGVLYGQHGLLEAALRFCAEHGLAFRLPRSLGSTLGASLSPAARTGHVEALALADELGVRLPETIATAWLPGAALESYEQLRATYLDALVALPEGTSEVFCHPAPEEATTGLPPAEARKRSWELRLLRDPTFTDALGREGIEVVPTW
ncbi:carbohydrate deacetylase [Georgenia subflava]|uniref:ChbG/HpnK family deacetylase n=1 Tax=Georgenia subflava TaxID=1622177 RepID=A0A6N7EL16_9MICO|nr:ChbG/HpnK family deacetylase [Georgenia subflava]MPV37778.1 ChbG/HpnK family deacetylase [Georgenia subflava]